MSTSMTWDTTRRKTIRNPEGGIRDEIRSVLQCFKKWWHQPSSQACPMKQPRRNRGKRQGSSQTLYPARLPLQIQGGSNPRSYTWEILHLPLVFILEQRRASFEPTASLCSSPPFLTGATFIYLQFHGQHTIHFNTTDPFYMTIPVTRVMDQIK